MKRFLTYTLLLATLAPLSALAADTTQSTVSIGANGQQTTTSSSAGYQFQRQGIFDCNQNGAYAMSVGSLSAAAGAYVPVADATVELNTGILVYKECILREVVDRERENALSALLKKTYVAVQTGKKGNPLYTQYIVPEQVQLSDQVFLNALQDQQLWNNVSASIRAAIQRAQAQYYQGETRLPQEASLTCPYKGDLQRWWSGQTSQSTYFVDFLNASSPQCDHITENFLVGNVIESRIARSRECQQELLDWGRGYYPVLADGTDPCYQKIETPSATVQESFQTQLDSPVRQLENANDIGQMIGALYAGVTTQIVSDAQGLAGLAKGSGGNPSYIEQLVSESAAGVRDAATNVALQTLIAGLNVERQYLQAAQAIAAALAQAATQLRSAENQCWNLIIQKTCATALTASKTCTAVAGPCTTDPTTGETTCPTGPTLKVATSTMFSDAVIASGIAPFQPGAQQQIQSSQQSLSVIQNLIAGVTNTASLDAQRISLQQWDALVAQHKVHIPPDLQTIGQQLSSVQARMQTLVQTDTVPAWADGTPTGQPFSATNQTGWCNVNKQAVVDYWINVWKQ